MRTSIPVNSQEFIQNLKIALMTHMPKKKTRIPYIPTKHSSFDNLRTMKHVELSHWYKEHKHFYDKIAKGDRRAFVLKMVSKLMYANLLRKRIINLA